MKKTFHFLAGLLVVAFWLGFFSPASVQAQQKYPRQLFLKTNSDFVKLFQPVVSKASQSTVRIYGDGKRVGLGTVVTEDGAIMTIASELEGAPIVELSDGRKLDARIVAQEERHNLALLKIDATGLTPVEWLPSQKVPVGSWAVSVGTGHSPIALGIISVAMRKIKLPKNFKPLPSGSHGYLGIMLVPGVKAAKIDRVVPKTGAARAGLKPGDVILSLAGKEVASLENLREILQNYKPGEKVAVKIQRGDQELSRDVVLGRRPASRGELQNRLGSKLSDRRTGFPVILQHDSIIQPDECGGPLVDLNGKAIGINIARAGRTESYAIPSEAVLSLLRDMLDGKHTTATAADNSHTSK